MRKINLAALGLLFAAVFSISAFAQAPAAAGKVGVIDTGAFFDDKPGAGIPKLKNAISSVNVKYKSVNDELTTLTTQYQQKVDEYNKLKNAAVPANPSDLDSKATAIQDLETTIKRKQEDAKSRYDREIASATDPINQDIMKAINDFAKAKGFAVIFDLAKLDQAGVIIGLDEKYDVTKDFITFYNQRGGTASTASNAATTTPPVAKPK
jgi:Skp family chaperone for outer membrane proteins